MDYFVNIEDTPYDHWQLELLIESFKILNLEDKLLVAVTSSTQNPIEEFLYNFRQHKRVINYPNIGAARGYNQLNRYYCLSACLEQGLLTQPFTLLEPDMILNIPIQEYSQNIVLQLDPFFNLEYINSQFDITKYLEIIKNPIKWIELGSTMVFKDVPISFFKSLPSLIEELAIKQIELSGKIFEDTDKIAMTINLMMSHNLSINCVYDLEVPLVGHEINRNIIHYEHGLPPFFNKKMFQFKSPINFAMGTYNPILAIGKETSTPATLVVSGITNEYAAKVFKLEDN